MDKFCTNCGAELSKGQEFCSSCGKKIKKDETDANNVNNKVVVNNSGNNKVNGFAIAGFVTSLVSGLLCCGSVNIVSLILSIVGLVKAKSLNGEGKGFSIAGIVISIVFILLWIFVLLLMIYEASLNDIVYDTASTI